MLGRIWTAPGAQGAHRDLSWFYSQWFDRSGAPEWHVETVDSAGIRHWAIRQLATPYQLTVRVDMTSERCTRRVVRMVLRGAYTLLPPSPVRCGADSIVVDPTYEILHWTPKLRKEPPSP